MKHACLLLGGILTMVFKAAQYSPCSLIDRCAISVPAGDFRTDKSYSPWNADQPLRDKGREGTGNLMGKDHGEYR